MSEPGKEPNPYKSPETEDAGAKMESGMPPAALTGTLAAAGVSVLIIIGLFLVSPGIGVLAALVLVPANLRAILAMRKEFRATGRWPEGWNQASAFVISTLIMIPIWIATGIAFYAVCWAGAMIAVSAFPKGDEYGFTNMIYGGIPIGLIAGLVSFMLCFRLTLRSTSGQAEMEDRKSKPTA
ncbi:hypothetical protein Pan97_21350 [Bremerella volcania]|uniref:Uncharacterized protein n=2 Tax=Bremerella volcania TaxID=2527984 RepID=A0A518C7D7_9BACT|nr:hypothetical protein Pan97_21350 [Bremerella volcania]